MTTPETQVCTDCGELVWPYCIHLAELLVEFHTAPQIVVCSGRDDAGRWVLDSERAGAS